MLSRPRDREVECHASAWDMFNPPDVRIKACLAPNEEDLYTIYHEEGHVYYYLSYASQPYLFRDGANDGFHEAIGDTVNLSVTPAYLAKIGLIQAVAPSREALINQQMKMALEKIAFLPFGRLIDQWRWKVFAGEITPANYNSSWWELRRKLPGRVRAAAAQRGRLRPGRQVPHPGQHPVHALLPVASSCSSSSTRRCARPPATTGRCTSAPTTATPPPAPSSPRCCSSAPRCRGRTRSRSSPAAVTSTPAPSPSTSSRCCSGWRSRTRDSSAAGSRARSGYSVTRTSVTKYSVSPKHELGTHLCCS